MDKTGTHSIKSVCQKEKDKYWTIIYGIKRNTAKKQTTTNQNKSLKSDFINEATRLGEWRVRAKVKAHWIMGKGYCMYICCGCCVVTYICRGVNFYS